MRRSTGRLELGVRGFESCHPEICDLDVLVRVEEEVLGSAKRTNDPSDRETQQETREREGDPLQISMTDVEAMAVANSVNDLLEVSQSLGRGQLPPRDEIVEELSSLDVLQDKEAVIRVEQRTGRRSDTFEGHLPLTRANEDERATTHSSLSVSHTSCKLITFGWSMSFMITISRSSPNSYFLALMSAAADEERDWREAAVERVDLGRILTAANWPVLECLAILTRPGDVDLIRGGRVGQPWTRQGRREGGRQGVELF